MANLQQPVGAHVKDHIQLRNICLGADNKCRARAKSNKLISIGYHSDVPFEHQTTGVAMPAPLEVPPIGVDTCSASQVVAYNRLSEPIQKLPEGLRAEHSGYQQGERARRDDKFGRREPLESEYSFVRVHPVTEQKALFIQPRFHKAASLVSRTKSETLC